MVTLANNGGKSLLIASMLLLLAACGGSSSPEAEPPPPVSKACETTDEDNTNDECGTLLIDVTDAEGDFVTYQVELKAMTLTKQDGTVVNVMPASSQLDFAQYTELSELVSAVTIPKGIYTKALVTLDYSDADVQVEKDGEAATALVVDALGEPIDQVEVSINLDNRDQLRIVPGVPAMLEIDFNLEASHEVDLQAVPVEAVLGTTLTAEINPLETKDFRIRGPMLRVNTDDAYYRIALRPFYHRIQQEIKFGGVNIHTDDDTLFDINGEMLQGSDGLALLAEQTQGTATVAFGTYDRSAGKFTAMQVYAGSSVPGGEFDAALGSVMAREADELTLKGVTLVRTDGEVGFHELVTVKIGDETHYKKQFLHSEELTKASVSVGQRVSVLGTFEALEESEDSDANQVLDATQGSVRLLLTSIAGTLNQDLGSELELDLQVIDRRNPDRFDFSGTGQSSDLDADPMAYQVGLGNLVPNPSINAPLRVTGFVNDFAAAPVDFNAASVIDYTESGAKMLVSWLDDGSAQAFSQLDANAMAIDLLNPELGERHYLRRGGIITDLNDLAEGWLMLPKSSGLGLFAIKESDNITLHSSFENFVSDLQARLDQGHLVKALFANGGYQEDTNQYQIAKMVVKLGANND